MSATLVPCVVVFKYSTVLSFVHQSAESLIQFHSCLMICADVVSLIELQGIVSLTGSALAPQDVQKPRQSISDIMYFA